MWFPKFRAPQINFIRIHYAYILFLSVAGMIVFYPTKNFHPIDAFFQACSAGTSTGLNTVDLKDAHTFQQMVCYLLPIIGNMAVINIVVVFVRLYWFERKFKDIVRMARQSSTERSRRHLLANTTSSKNPQTNGTTTTREVNIRVLRPDPMQGPEQWSAIHSNERDHTSLEERVPTPNPPDRSGPGHISFSSDTFDKPKREKALRIPGPREFESGETVQEVDEDDESDIETGKRRKSIDSSSGAGPSGLHRRDTRVGRLLSRAASVEQAATSAFILGIDQRTISRSRSRDAMSRTSSRTSQPPETPYLSYTPTIGRNSKFIGLTEEQREELGGIEYRSLKLLSKIAAGYYIFLHAFGGLMLLAWIYGYGRDHQAYLKEIGVRPTWWAFFSSMTMFCNVGFTLTPDSMVSFRANTFPMLWMTFLAFIGNTAYPCVLRLVIWTMFRLTKKNAPIREPLNFLLDHPRRCYTLLFPSKVTWLLFGSLVVINGVDVILFLVLDLHYPEVSSIDSGWHRFCAALFQAASARTTGTTSFALSKIHPAVQFSLMVMMYISVFPIALSMRGTNTYEESSLGIFDSSEELYELKRTSYLGNHIKMQLAFDLWYVFLGIFVLAITEGKKIFDEKDPSFHMFAITFEAFSAYGNVGLSLGHSAVNTALVGRFSVLGKLVICALMVRGRHRGLPYEVDRAIILPGEKRQREEDERVERMSRDLSRPHTR